MSEAKTMFNKLGFKLVNSDGNLLYQFKTDYIEVWVAFGIDLKTYSVREYRFIEIKGKEWIPMKDRSESTKHSCKYGWWQIENFYDISIELHNAIHRQMEELGWIK